MTKQEKVKKRLSRRGILRFFWTSEEQDVTWSTKREEFYWPPLQGQEWIFHWHDRGIPSSGYTETMKRKLLRCTASRWHLLHVTSGVARFNYVKLIYQALLNNNTACINEGWVWMDEVTNTWSWNQPKCWDCVKRDISAKNHKSVLIYSFRNFKPVWLLQNGKTANEPNTLFNIIKCFKMTKSIISVTSVIHMTYVLQKKN